MSYNFEKLLGENFSGNIPLAAEEIAATDRNLRKSLPDDFLEFLQTANGGEGFIGKSYVILWNAEELGPYNESYQVSEYAPGLLLFGSDGGGEGYAFDLRTSPPGVVSVPFVGMSLKYAKPVAPTFIDFLKTIGG